jgi:hypothetical protein
MKKRLKLPHPYRFLSFGLDLQYPENGAKYWAEIGVVDIINSYLSGLDVGGQEHISNAFDVLFTEMKYTFDHEFFHHVTMRGSSNFYIRTLNWIGNLLFYRLTENESIPHEVKRILIPFKSPDQLSREENEMLAIEKIITKCYQSLFIVEEIVAYLYTYNKLKRDEELNLDVPISANQFENVAVQKLQENAEKNQFANYDIKTNYHSLKELYNTFNDEDGASDSMLMMLVDIAESYWLDPPLFLLNDNDKNYNFMNDLQQQSLSVDRLFKGIAILQNGLKTGSLPANCTSIYEGHMWEELYYSLGDEFSDYVKTWDKFFKSFVQKRMPSNFDGWNDPSHRTLNCARMFNRPALDFDDDLERKVKELNIKTEDILYPIIFANKNKKPSVLYPIYFEELNKLLYIDTSKGNPFRATMALNIGWWNLRQQHIYGDDWKMTVPEPFS